MASSINASTSGAGGVITTADNSGILNLQSGGTTVATVSSSGFSTPANQTINTANTFGFKNRIINGGMVIDQRNAGASVSLPDGTVAYSFPVDRWACARATGATATGQQSTTVPSSATFINSLVITNGTGITVASTGEGYVNHYIEGLNVADLGWGTANAKTVTLSFWVQSSITGTHSGSFFNGAANRSYPFTYTISSANTWEQKSITVAGDTSGTWLKTNGRGIVLCFNNGSGSNFMTTANAWASGLYYGATGSVALNSVTGSTWYITGVQLEVGSQATSFDFRDYGRELQLCQRYYWKKGGSQFGGAYMPIIYMSAVTSGTITGAIDTPVQMRTTPSFSTGGSAGTNTLALDRASYSQIMVYATGSFTTFYTYRYTGDANATTYLEFSSEL